MLQMAPNDKLKPVEIVNWSQVLQLQICLGGMCCLCLSMQQLGPQNTPRQTQINKFRTLGLLISTSQLNKHTETVSVQKWRHISILMRYKYVASPLYMDFCWTLKSGGGCGGGSRNPIQGQTLLFSEMRIFFHHCLFEHFILPLKKWGPVYES